MGKTELTICAAALVATMAATGGSLLAQQAPGPGVEAKAKAAVLAAMAQAEAKVAEIRDLVRPRPGEHVTNMARIAWEHDPWEAALVAGREGKTILAWGECGAGVPCGYGCVRALPPGSGRLAFGGLGKYFKAGQ